MYIYNCALALPSLPTEQFIVNFSVPYSPLHRHLVGVSEAPTPQSLIQEVTTQSFRAIVMDNERVRRELFTCSRVPTSTFTDLSVSPHIFLSLFVSLPFCVGRVVVLLHGMVWVLYGS